MHKFIFVSKIALSDILGIVNRWIMEISQADITFNIFNKINFCDNSGKLDYRHILQNAVIRQKKEPFVSII